MRYNQRGYQSQARRLAENIGPVNGRKYRELRIENAKRVLRAQARRVH